MKIVRLMQNIVREIVPLEATIPSVEYWYGLEFAAQCIEASDEVQTGWIYDTESGILSEPPVLPPSPPTAEERIVELEQANTDKDALILAQQEIIQMIDGAFTDFLIYTVPLLGTGA